MKLFIIIRSLISAAIISANVGMDFRGNTNRTRPPRSAERRLYDRLFDDYDPGCRPVINANNTVTVTLSISLTQIMDLVEKNQTLMTQLWIYEEWTDETLVWKPKKFEGISSLIVPSARLWVPDIYIFNNADNGDDGFVSLNQSRATIHSDGRVQWILPLIVQSACAVDVTYFPFDKQSCYVRFGSWIYDDSQMNLSMKNEDVDLSSYSPNTELDLIDVSLAREAGINNRPQITARLHIRRKPLYYTYTVLAPTLVLCILNLFSFLLPCDNGDKVGIGLTVFLSLYVLQLAIAENIPESNSLPLIGLFLTLVMTLNAISLMCATLVINIKKKGDLRYCPLVPDPVMTFFKEVLGRITCTPFVNFYHYYGNCEEPEECLKWAARNDWKNKRDSLAKDKTVFPDESPFEKASEVSGPTTSFLSPDNTATIKKRRMSDFLIIPKVIQRRGSECPPKQTTDAEIFCEEKTPQSKAMENFDIYQRGQADLLKRNVENNGISSAKSSPPDERREPRDARYEWFFVAEILDKTLFLLFFLTMMTTVLVSLVVVPWIHG